MASIGNDSNGRRRILFLAPDGRRKTIRVGKMSKRHAMSFKLRVEDLVGAALVGHAPSDETSRWLVDLDDTSYSRLVAVGLAKPREPVSRRLDNVLADYFDMADVKPATAVRYGQTRKSLLAHFGEDCDVDSITERDAEAWRANLRARYSLATVSRAVMHARTFWRWAIRRGRAKTNPFLDIKAGPQTNTSRQMFVDAETITKVVNACPDDDWRLLIVLSRFGGLRVPSEALALRWSDVDWEHDRLAIRSVKTEHHEGHADRQVPIFPQVREWLIRVFEQAADGAEYVITRYRLGTNLNPQLRRIVVRAGLTPWPRTWHNLRASRQTELASRYPLHTVCAWMGNTKAIASGHYLQVTDADWQRAVSREAEFGEVPRSASEGKEKAAQNPAQKMRQMARNGQKARKPKSEKTSDFSEDFSSDQSASIVGSGQSRT